MRYSIAIKKLWFSRMFNDIAKYNDIMLSKNLEYIILYKVSHMHRKILN